MQSRLLLPRLLRSPLSRQVLFVPPRILKRATNRLAATQSPLPLGSTQAKNTAPQPRPSRYQWRRKQQASQERRTNRGRSYCFLSGTAEEGDLTGAQSPRAARALAAVVGIQWACVGV